MGKKRMRQGEKETHNVMLWELVRVCGPQHALNSGIPDYMFIMLGPKNKIKINTNIKIKIKIKLTIIIRSTSDSKSNSK